ncbi:hypothetical protein [Amycolatopsis sp. NPDC098790]|uniref:hypothetical protein n=1 Tax=Amycolatopsis sp. NPDC098790 TaxID=3363939 RepID=UPI0038242D08
MILSTAGSDLFTRACGRPGAAPWAFAVMGAVLVAWSQSVLAGLLVTAVVATVVAAATALRRAGRQLEAMVAEELEPDPSSGVGPGS